MRAASPPRQMERENEMIVISQLLLNLRKFRKSVDGKAGSDYNEVQICESVANLRNSFCFRKRGGRRGCYWFYGCSMLPDHGGAHCLSQAMRERILFLSGDMSSLLSTVKEFLL